MMAFSLMSAFPDISNSIKLTRVFTKHDAPSSQINRRKSHYRSFPFLLSECFQLEKIMDCDVLLYCVVVAFFVTEPDFAFYNVFASGGACKEKKHGNR